MSKIFLRALEMGDFEFTHKWHNDQELYGTFAGAFRYVSEDAEKEWLQQKSSFNNQEINLMICLTDSAKPIGIISVREINWVSRLGQLSGIAICDPDYSGKGYGSEALSLMLKHCFEGLGFNRVWAYILYDNLISQQMFKKCGFEIEGRLKQHVYKNGQFKDLILVGLCAKEYFQDNNKLLG